MTMWARVLSLVSRWAFFILSSDKDALSAGPLSGRWWGDLQQVCVHVVFKSSGKWTRQLLRSWWAASQTQTIIITNQMKWHLEHRWWLDLRNGPWRRCIFFCHPFYSMHNRSKKRPFYGWLKIKQSYDIVRYYMYDLVRILRRPADSNECRFGYHRRRRASDSRNKLFLPILLLLILLKPFDGGLGQPLLQRRPGVGYARPTKPCHWRGKRVHHVGDVCLIMFR